MRDRVRLHLQFDAEAMRRDLERLREDDWVDHFVKQNYEGSWSVLPLRARAGAQHPIETIYSDPSSDDFVDTPLLAECSYFQQVLAEFQCPLYSVRLMRLTPGSLIKPHADHDLGSEYGRVRLHIPIVTNREVDFRLNGEPVVMREGECWYLRLSDSHSVANRGQTDRVHLVIDALLDAWLEAQLMAAEESAQMEARDLEEIPAIASSTAVSDFKRFRRVVLQDPSLQRQLNDASEWRAFEAHACRLAAQSGCRVTAEELERARWDRQSSTEAAETDSELPLTDWIPYRVREEGARHVVDWCYRGGVSFTDPFFEQTIQYCLARPFNRLFARQTAIEIVTGWRRARPGIPPTAFIFHSSRCGSTLFSQMATVLPGTVVVSEAPPIDQIVRARASEAQRLEWLDAIVSALGQRHRGDERHLFVKLDAWHVLDLPIFRRAFPDAPFVFLYRDPAEVIASQMRMPGTQMIPGMLDPSLLGLDLQAAIGLDREEYCARVLALFYASAAAYAEAGLATLMNYCELPGAASRRLLEWCGITPTEDIHERLRRVTQFDAKNPSFLFDAADVSSRPAPGERAIAAAVRYVNSSYERLESMRLNEPVLD